MCCVLGVMLFCMLIGFNSLLSGSSMFEYIVLVLSDVDVSFLGYRCKYCIFSLADFGYFGISVLIFFLLVNIMGLFDIACLSIYGGMVIGMSFMILRVVDLIGWYVFSTSFVLLLTLDLGYTIVLVNVFLCYIECISNIFRSISLGFRLFANILAGHLIVIMLVSVMVGGIVHLNVLMIFGVFSVLACIIALEMAMVALQSYVFSVLIKVFVKDIF